MILFCDFSKRRASPLRLSWRRGCFWDKTPDPPILAFLDFLAFFVFRFSLSFLCVFPFFSKDFRGSAKRRTLAFCGASLLLKKKKQGLEGQGNSRRFAIAMLLSALQGHLADNSEPEPEHRCLLTTMQQSLAEVEGCTSLQQRLGQVLGLPCLG